LDFGRAFTYVFDDPDWVSKLAMLVLLTFASALLMPVLLLGLLPLCVVFGYMLDIIENVHKQRDIILPKWDNYGESFTRGASVLLALIVYNLPFTLVTMCASFAPGAFVDEAARGFVVLVLACCLGPAALIYTVAAWMMMAVATSRYARGARAGVFFQVGDLFGAVQRGGTASIQWFFFSLIANVIFLIPCIGWIAGVVLTIPVQGHLIGQYSRQIDSKPKKRT